MLRVCARKCLSPLTSFARHFHVTVLGAATDIGQTVTLLLRAQPAITKLVTHDYQTHSPGVLLDVSHIPATSALEGYYGEDTIDRALAGANLVIVVGDAALKPGITRESCLATNVYFITRVMARIARVSPSPLVGILAEPINSIVPMAAEVMRNNGYYDGRKMFGITGIDTLRAQCLYAMVKSLNPWHSYIPVIGGHSEKTTIPLLSHRKPCMLMDDKEIQELTAKIRKGDEIVTKAKKGRSPSLSVAYSALTFVQGILHALNGNPCRVQAFVENNDFGTTFFSGLVNVTQDGAGSMQRHYNLTNYECSLLEAAICELRKDIAKGTKILEKGSVDVD